MPRIPSWQVTTLKRDGSDYRATILGALFQSGHITIWTDVDGVYSADPRKVMLPRNLPSGLLKLPATLIHAHNGPYLCLHAMCYGLRAWPFC